MKECLPKISVVVPNYNQELFIEKALLSILDQDYPNLEVIVIDGGSTDGSVNVIRKYSDKLSYWVSEPDKGMYDALNKGFSKSSGDIMCWLNSDDFLWPDSLRYVARLFTIDKDIKWLQGRPSVINEAGELIYQRDAVFSKYFFFLKLHESSFSFIQQESTFWKRSLWIKAGASLNTNYKVAADFDLWMRFFAHENLYCSKKKLGAFRVRKGQLSGNREAYLKEADQSLTENYRDIPIYQKLYVRFLLKLNSSKLRMLKRMFDLIVKGNFLTPSHVEDKFSIE